MAIPFLNNITLNNNEIQDVRLQNAGSPPLNFGPGQIYFDSTQLPAIVDTAKYYANGTDTWVSLKEYAFPAVLQADGYITSVITGTAPKPSITFNLNAVNGVAIANERYLTKSNTWTEVSNGTVTSITAGVGLTGGAITTSGTITLDYNGVNNYILANPNGIAIPESDSSINFSSNQDDNVHITALGAIPVDALTLVKNYIDNSVAGGLIYQGGYDATTNTPDLTTSPNSILKGWTYTVTVEGTFFGEQLRVGDVLIAEVDGPTSLADWTTVQNNIDFATAGTDIGAGAAIVGISRYDEDDFTVSSTGFVQLNTSYAVTIAAAVTSIAHGLNSSDVIVQLYDIITGETVYADVDRISPTQVTITFAATPTNSVRVLVQKIG